jgi:LytS/YehU family sensor histidine kinase
VAGIIGYSYHYKLRQSILKNKLIAEKETLKAEAEKQLAHLEMTALKAQMNPHFIFNCLNSINRFIIVNDNEAASEYLTKFAKLIRQVLENSRGEKISLATEIETLKLYIEMESLRFLDKFQYTLEIDPRLRVERYVVHPMLIQPYVENAIWHGLMHRRTKGLLSISFCLAENGLKVVIRDNGVGREKAKQIKESQLVPKKSYGMKVTAERMALLSKNLNVPVSVTVEDLHNEQHVAEGTEVILLLPLELLPESDQ